MPRIAKERSTDWSDLPKGAGQQVLVVDDEVALVRLMQRNLGDLGYQAEAFNSSAAALRAFRHEPRRYDAVVTDARMPGLSGTDLVREMHGIRADLPALIVSGHVDDNLLNRAVGAGAVEVLKKPIALADLASALARCVP